VIAGPVQQDLAYPNLCFPGLAEAFWAGPSGTPSHLARNFGPPAPDMELALADAGRAREVHMLVYVLLLRQAAILESTQCELQNVRTLAAKTEICDHAPLHR